MYISIIYFIILLFRVYIRIIIFEKIQGTKNNILYQNENRILDILYT